MTGSLPVLFGKFLSPYVRRVGVTMHVLGMPFERSVISAIDDEAKREAVNPVGRVPALSLVSGEVLIDSVAILDYLDELAGQDRALVPHSGKSRRDALQSLAIATGAIDRAMTANAERRRADPDATRIERLLRQCRQGFDVLEERLHGRRFFNRDALQQTDITAAIGFRFVNHIFPGTLPDGELPALLELSRRCEEMEAFRLAEIEEP